MGSPTPHPEQMLPSTPGFRSAAVKTEVVLAHQRGKMQRKEGRQRQREEQQWQILIDVTTKMKLVVLVSVQDAAVAAADDD